ncbi:MAG: glycosyltransferase family 39 protein [Phycisphaerae bacterium]|nr:glycosyltransferase family 39 protein [Phycisphaerae bacterium]
MFGSKRNLAILVVLQIVLGLVYLNSVPRTHIDEVWDSSLGYNLAHQGSLKHPFIEGFGGMDIHFIQSRVVLPLVNAAIFKIVDYSIATSRIGSVLFGALAVVSIYAVTRRWFGEKQAFWIGLATIIHPWFFDASRRARPEIYYTALALVFLWLMVVFFDSGSRRSALFAGVFAGLSSLAHPTGLIIVFIIGCVIIVRQRGKLIGRLIPWAAVGFVVTILPYVIYVFWAIRNPQVSFTEQMQIGMLHKLLLRGEINRWKSFLQWPEGAPLAIIMLASWVLAWYRSTAADKILASIIVLLALILPFATVSPTARYLVVITPLLCALVVRLIWRVIEDKGVILQNWYKLRFAISVGTAVIYLSTGAVFIGLMFYCLHGADFNKVINHVASAVGRESRIYGNPIFWVGHDKYKYGPYPVIYKDFLLKDGLKMARKHHFDYAVRTAWLVAPPDAFGRPSEVMPMFRDDCLGDWICRRFGTKIDEFYDPYYGPIEIYKLNWESSPKILKVK